MVASAGRRVAACQVVWLPPLAVLGGPAVLFSVLPQDIQQFKGSMRTQCLGYACLRAEHVEPKREQQRAQMRMRTGTGTGTHAHTQAGMHTRMEARTRLSLSMHTCTTWRALTNAHSGVRTTKRGVHAALALCLTLQPGLLERWLSWVWHSGCRSWVRQ